MSAVPQNTTLQDQVKTLVADAARGYLNSLELSPDSMPELPEIALQMPRNPDHGDWACNVAMLLAKPLKSNPLKIAEGIVARIPKCDVMDTPEAAPPGFINIRVGHGAISQTIKSVLSQKENFGRSDAFAGQRALVEFVSANPTGPLHIGHGRNAVVGDTIARIYQAAGFEVEREYYLNDAGVQMGKLGESLRARYLNACGIETPFPEDGYHGDYVTEIAQRLKAEIGDAKTGETGFAFFSDYASKAVMVYIHEDLKALGIKFDHFYSETSLHREGRVEKVISRLRESGHVYESEGALWLKTTPFGDEKDRVVRKSDGTFTYLSPDIAYHEDKLARGYDRLVNVLGGDHHSYVIRLKAAIEALGHKSEKLHAILIQMVSLEVGGEAKKLGKRSGEFITLKSILDQIGSDLVRCFFLLRSADSQMVFDLELAQQQTMDNPYWYLQYAHARCCSLLAKAAEKGMAWGGGANADTALLTAPEERAIVFQMSRLPGVVIESAKKDEPLLLTTYLRELATAFHSYFSAGNKNESLRCIQSANAPLTEARLTLIAALKQTLANGLGILGLNAIERL